MVNKRPLDSGFRHTCWAWSSASRTAKDTEKEGHAPVRGCTDPIAKRARSRWKERGHPLALLLHWRRETETCTSTCPTWWGRQAWRCENDLKMRKTLMKKPNSLQSTRRGGVDTRILLSCPDPLRTRQTTSGWKIRSKEGTEMQKLLSCATQERKSPLLLPQT